MQNTSGSHVREPPLSVSGVKVIAQGSLALAEPQLLIQNGKICSGAHFASPFRAQNGVGQGKIQLGHVYVSPLCRFLV